MPLPAAKIAVPGQPLSTLTEYLPGTGIHTRHDGILSASIVGRIHLDKSTTPPTLSVIPGLGVSPPSLESVATSTIEHERADSVGMGNIINPTTLLPQVGSTVLCRVTRTNPRQANVSIFAMDIPTISSSSGEISTTISIPTGDTFPGAIRVQDVRATEKDKVKIASSFKPGDIVRAVVISLGDQSNYYLSTGKNEFGVVVARSDSGDLLYPKSWKEMICSRTGLIEERKVAKPI